MGVTEVMRRQDSVDSGVCQNLLLASSLLKIVASRAGLQLHLPSRLGALSAKYSH